MPTSDRDSAAQTMTPFIIFTAFVILMTIILISIYKMHMEDMDWNVKSAGFSLSLDSRQPIRFDDNFLFPGFTPISAEDDAAPQPNIQRDILHARRLLAERNLPDAEDHLRTLFLFYPDDPEVLYLLISVLRATDRSAEAEYYRDRMLFLTPWPDPSFPGSGLENIEQDGGRQ